MLVKKLTVGFGTNCYLIADEKTKKGAVIDPGGDASGILREAKSMQIQIGDIFLTHAHFDHIMAACEVKEACGAALTVHRLETGWLKKEKAEGDFPMIAGRYREVSAERAAEDGDVFAVGGISLRWLHTPGHTPGSSVLLAEDHMFSGDTLFAGSCGRCDFPGGDSAKMMSSLRRLYSLKGDYFVHPGHMEETTLEAERAGNPYMREAVAREI